MKLRLMLRDNLLDLNSTPSTPMCNVVSPTHTLEMACTFDLHIAPLRIYTLSELCL